MGHNGTNKHKQYMQRLHSESSVGSFTWGRKGLFSKGRRQTPNQNYF